MINPPRALLATLLLGALAFSAHALEVSDAWTRVTVPGQQVGAAYMTLTSVGKARLISVRSPACKRVEIHSSSMVDGTMRMRRLKALDLPAGQAVSLAPMGTHLMLMELVAPLKEGDHIDLELTVQEGGKRKKIPVTAEVRSLMQ